MKHSLAELINFANSLKNTIILDVDFPQQCHCSGVNQKLDMWTKPAPEMCGFQVKQKKILPCIR